MKRRELFGALAALAVAPTAPLARPIPRLYGDGIHDDTAALQRLLDEPVDYVFLPEGNYRITSSLVFKRGTMLRNSVIHNDHQGSAIVVGDGVQGCVIVRNTITGGYGMSVRA
jgi:hypothetical protein